MRGSGKNTIFSICLLVVITFITGCNNNEISEENNYSLLLEGESQNWKLEAYEVTISPEVRKVGNGTLTMKTNSGYKTDYLSLEIHTVIDGQDKVVHQKQVAGETDIVQTKTGAIEGNVFLDKSGKPIELETVNDIYIVIKWRDRKENETVTEEIDLFQ